MDLIIPRDERSGSATDAGVPEFMDFMMSDQDTAEEARTAMRRGLAWVDAECRRRFGRRFTGCAGRERTALLDDIAWPARARPEMSHGVEFLNSFRDLTASGFWSSEMGVKDLQVPRQRLRSRMDRVSRCGAPEGRGALRGLGLSHRERAICPRGDPAARSLWLLDCFGRLAPSQ